MPLVLIAGAVVLLVFALTRSASAQDVTDTGNQSSNPDMGNVNLPSDVSSLIEQVAPQYGLDPNLIKAQCWQESRGNPNAVSPAGAKGLMQLMPATFAGMGYDPAQILDPEVNMNAGCRYMAEQVKRFNGDISLALAAYNAGAGNVIKYGGIPPFAETQNYVSIILGHYQSSGDMVAEVNPCCACEGNV